MQKFFPRRLTLAVSMALLMLIGCANQPNAKNSGQPAASSVPDSNRSQAIGSTPVEAKTNQVESTQAKAQLTTQASAMDLLSADQKTRLAQLGVKVVLPTYLPAGFQLAQFDAHRKNSSDPTDYTYYTVAYRGPNDMCVEAGNGYQNNSLATSQERSLSTAVGTFKILSGTYRRTPITRHWAALPEGQVILTGGRFPDGQRNCNPIEEQAFDQVLQSAEAIASETAPEPASVTPTGNLLSAAQVEQLTKLPIPIVAPTYLPKGFRVVRAEGGSDKYANGDDDAGYGIDYQAEDGTCFAISSSKDGPRRLKQVGQVESVVGPIKMYEEIYEGKRSVQSFIPVKGNPVMISPVSRLNPATGNYEQCKALDPGEYEHILSSMDYVK